MKMFRLDLRYSLRIFRKNPSYTAITILLLALGIGANTAIFSVANSVLLRPLPYADPERLVVTLHGGDAPVSPADYLDYKKSVRAFEQMGAAQMWGGSLTGGDRPEQIPGVQVTANMMSVLGVAPVIGRTFTPEEEHAGNSNVLLLSYALWQGRFGGDSGVVGKRVSLDRVPYTVIGVMPRGFQFAPFWATRAQMWSPLVLDNRLNDRGGRSLRVFARLREGVSVAEAQAEMDAFARHLAESYPQTNAKLGISVVPLREKVVRSIRPTLLVLLGTVGFVLLIACATVGNLMLARAVARRKEMALRLAVGAGASDLIRMILTEVLVLAASGGIVGILLGHWAVGLAIETLPPGSIPRLADLGFDGTTMLFAGAVTLVTAALAGLLPSMQALRANLNADLKGANRGSDEGGTRGRTRSVLIGAEVALSLVLLAGAGLMMRTMLALQAVDAGFNFRHLLTMQIAISGTDYNQNGRRSTLFGDVRNRLAQMPGVQSVSAINHLPIGGDLWNLEYTIEGRPKPAPGDETSAIYRVAMRGYFHTMQIGLIQGRDFDERDNERAPLVAVINEAMAKRQWPGESPVGKIIHYGITGEEQTLPRTVIGVVRNARQNDWTSPLRDEIYLPYDQRPDSMGLSYLTFVLRTHRDPNGMADAARKYIGAFNKNLPVSELTSMDRVVANELWRQRLATAVIGAFAGVAVLLAAVGIYGVISYSMRYRIREIAIRMALGAESSDLVGLALREGMKPVFVGTFAGLICALALTRYMMTLLYGVTAADPLTFACIVAALLAVCLSANLIPALRTTRVDPLVALRQD
jgi:predicted permease